MKVVPGPCSQMSETRVYDCTGCSMALFFYKYQRLNYMTVQVVPGLCYSHMSKTRLHDCAGCWALLLTNVRD